MIKRMIKSCPTESDAKTSRRVQRRVVNPLTRSVSSPDADHGAGSGTCAMGRFQVLASKRRRWPVSGASSRRFMTSDASARISGRAWRA
jgi:hypothetical protein